MFENLSERLNSVFKKLKGEGKLTEENIEEALRDVRMALLEADVNFKVVKEFVAAIAERAVGQEVLDSLSPGQQVIKVVHEELVALLGAQSVGLNMGGRQPVPIMLVGLQGSGKTTTAGKLALRLKKQGRRVLLVPADVYRPAAIEQLKVLGQKLSVEVYPSRETDDPVAISRGALTLAQDNNFDTVLIDTAGRLHIDQTLMEELSKIKEATQPAEILFVADAMTGQDAVTVAEAFNKDLGITGIVLTKMEGDARGGAALSIKKVTDRPIKFVGTGEALDALEVFHPDRVASRILGMGDVLTLIEKAEAVVDRKQAEALAQKIRKNTFTLEDFLDQIQQIKKIGPMEQLLDMIPGINKIKQLKNAAMPDEKELVRVEAIIKSMTLQERRNYLIINANRRKRIALGSGTSVQDVNKVVKSYSEMLKMMKRFNKKGIMSPGGGGKKRRKMPKGLFR